MADINFVTLCSVDRLVSLAQGLVASAKKGGIHTVVTRKLSSLLYMLCLLSWFANVSQW